MLGYRSISIILLALICCIAYGQAETRWLYVQDGRPAMIVSKTVSPPAIQFTRQDLFYSTQAYLPTPEIYRTIRVEKIEYGGMVYYVGSIAEYDNSPENMTPQQAYSWYKIISDNFNRGRRAPELDILPLSELFKEEQEPVTKKKYTKPGVIKPTTGRSVLDK